MSAKLTRIACQVSRAFDLNLNEQENQQTRLGDYKLIKMDRQKFIRPDRQMVRISRKKLIIPEREAATQRMLAGLQRETKTADIAKTDGIAYKQIKEIA